MRRWGMVAGIRWEVAAPQVRTPIVYVTSPLLSSRFLAGVELDEVGEGVVSGGEWFVVEFFAAVSIEHHPVPAISAVEVSDEVSEQCGASAGHGVVFKPHELCGCEDVFPLPNDGIALHTPIVPHPQPIFRSPPCSWQQPSHALIEEPALVAVLSPSVPVLAAEHIELGSIGEHQGDHIVGEVGFSAV